MRSWRLQMGWEILLDIARQYSRVCKHVWRRLQATAAVLCVRMPIPSCKQHRGRKSAVFERTMLLINRVASGQLPIQRWSRSRLSFCVRARIIEASSKAFDNAGSEGTKL